MANRAGLINPTAKCSVRGNNQPHEIVKYIRTATPGTKDSGLPGASDYVPAVHPVNESAECCRWCNGQVTDWAVIERIGGVAIVPTV